MESRIMQVFYGNDCLPYKDVERKVHYPVVGNTFVGANNTTQIRFYVDRIGGTENVKWVAVSKLPNGQIGNEVLGDDKIHFDETNNEYYVALDLNKFYTSLKGDVAIALKGFEGGIEVIEDGESGVLIINGSPTIQATGTITITINYAPQIIPQTNLNFTNLQLILAELVKKLDKINGFYIIDDIENADLTSFTERQYFFDIKTGNFYVWDGSTYELAPVNVYLYELIQGKADKSELGTQVNYDLYNGVLTITTKA